MQHGLNREIKIVCTPITVSDYSARSNIPVWLERPSCHFPQNPSFRFSFYIVFRKGKMSWVNTKSKYFYDCNLIKSSVRLNSPFLILCLMRMVLSVNLHSPFQRNFATGSVRLSLWMCCFLEIGQEESEDGLWWCVSRKVNDPAKLLGNLLQAGTSQQGGC